MGDLGAIIQATLNLFKYEFTIYGFTFSFWNVFLFVVVGGLALSFIGRIFHD